MYGKLLSKLGVFLLRSKRLRGEDKLRVMIALLDNVGALPLKSIITFDEMGTLLINGQRLEIEKAIQFKEGCVALQNSEVRKLIHDQVMFKAIQMGVHNGLTTEMIMFSKAAIWWGQQENELLGQITNE